MAKITIDGQEHEFPDGMNLFEACEMARGEKLPHFCYHPGLSIAGVCRMCQVELEGSPKLLIACNAKVQSGMVVRTQTARVQETVQQILNFHLLHHPVDCPVCDQAGECSLQDLYMRNGLYDASIDVDDKLPKAKVKPIGELVMLDAERCVLCARCTRFTSEITKTHELGIFNRGNHSEIDVAPGQTLDNGYSLNTVDICPVGALTSRDFRFKRRVWWLSETESICPGCATGCNMVIDHSENAPYRLRPRLNAEVNRWWMCDHGRLLYHEIQSPTRLTRPLLRDEASGLAIPVAWDAAYRRIEQWISEVGSERRLVVVGSPHATLEELYATKSIFGSAGAMILGYRLIGSEMGEADQLLLHADRTPNAEAARRLGYAEFDADALAGAASAKTALLMVGNDLAGLSVEAAKALHGFGLVIYLRDRADASSRVAHVTLAGANHAEKEGIFVNAQGRAQIFHAALASPGEARNDLRILAELATLFGRRPVWSDAASVRLELGAREDGFAAIAAGIDASGRPLDAVASRSEVGR